MESRVTLLLICTLFSEALSLTCQHCTFTSPDDVKSCKEIVCTDQCFSMTTAMYSSGRKVSEVNLKTCGVPEMCTSWSMNLGITKMTSNAKCCSTDLCNAETLPALPNQAPNGRQCYTCDTVMPGTSCSGTVQCEGIEDRCISVSGTDFQFAKGCVSKNICFDSASSIIPGVDTSNIQCCEGNLCNGTGTNTGTFSGSGTGTNTGTFSGNGTGTNTGTFSGNGTGTNTGTFSGNGTGTNTGSSSGNGTGTNTGSSSGNGTGSFTLSFLLLIMPLLFSTLFY